MSKLTKGYGSGGMQAILGVIKTYYEGELAKKANTSDIPVITGKADKVSNATSGHLAGLDSNGNLTDSGVSPTEDVTVEGNPVTFDSPFEQDAKSVVVSVKPIQDLHGYDHPWVGGAGKNKFDDDDEYVNNSFIDSDGSIASDNSYRYYPRYYDIKSSTNYTFQFNKLQTNARSCSLAEYDENKTFIQTIDMINGGSGTGVFSTTFTTSANTKYLRLAKISKATYSNDIQIEEGSTATSYEPYSNICPISGIDEVEIGVSGKNQFDKSKVVQGTKTEPLSGNRCCTRGFFGLYLHAGDVVTYSSNSYDIWCSFEIIDKDYNTYQDSGWITQNTTITITASGYAYFGFRKANNSNLQPSDIQALNIQLELGSSATTYEPYKGSTTTIPLPSTLYDADVDVTEGSADSRKGFTRITSSMNFRKSSLVTNGFYTDAFLNIIGLNVICSHYNSQNGVSSMTDVTEGSIAVDDGSVTLGNKGRLYINSQFSSLDDFNAFLDNNNVDLAYELATPTTLSLTPTDVELLEGTNVVTTNGEKVAVTYKAGILATLGDIDDLNDKVKTKFDKKDVAKVEGANASTAYSVGDYMLRSDGFYRVTANIASGAAITSNNTTKVTVGGELANKVNNDDSRLSNARTPVAHTHNISDITGIPAWSKLGEVTGTSPDYANSSTFNLSALQNKDVLMIFSVEEGALTAKQGIITLEYSAFEFGKILEDSVQEEDEITRLWKGFYGGAPRQSVATFEEFLRGLGYVYIATHSTTAEIGAKIYGAYDWTLEIYTK